MFRWGRASHRKRGGGGWERSQLVWTQCYVSVPVQRINTFHPLRDTAPFDAEELANTFFWDRVWVLIKQICSEWSHINLSRLSSQLRPPQAEGKEQNLFFYFISNKDGGCDQGADSSLSLTLWNRAYLSFLNFPENSWIFIWKTLTYLRDWYLWSMGLGRGIRSEFQLNIKNGLSS